MPVSRKQFQIMQRMNPQVQDEMMLFGCWLVPEEPPETLLWEICSNSVMWHANFAFSLLAVSLAQNARGEERLKPSNIPFLFYP